MRRDYFLAVGAVVLVALTTVAQGQSQHLAEAVTHVQAAVAKGKQGYPDELVAQAQEALKHAESAKKETANLHVDEGIRQLRSAIDHGKQGHGDVATKAAESALAHLSEAMTPTSGSTSGDNGY